jgi:hypothetical protein
MKASCVSCFRFHSTSVLNFILVTIVLQSFTCNGRPVTSSWEYKAYNKTYLIPPAGDNYSLAHFFDMIEGQKFFFEDLWKIEGSFLNPSMTNDPTDLSTLIYTHRIPTKTKYERTGYFIFPYSGTKQFQPVSSFRRLPIGVPGEWEHDLYGEDIRIFTHNYEIFIYYNFHMHVKTYFYSRLLYNKVENSLYLFNLTTNVRFQGQNQLRHEKNWVSFEYCPHCIFKHGILSPEVFQQYYKDHPNEPIVRNSPPSPVYPFEAKHNFSHIQNAQLFFVYSVQPHVIVKFYKTMSYDEEWAEMIFATEFTDFVWPWGELRGGELCFIFHRVYYVGDLFF